eukprot:scaffold4667_cov116-Isochrysis_galbana.AAC.5
MGVSTLCLRCCGNKPRASLRCSARVLGLSDLPVGVGGGCRARGVGAQGERYRSMPSMVGGGRGGGVCCGRMPSCGGGGMGQRNGVGGTGGGCEGRVLLVAAGTPGGGRQPGAWAGGEVLRRGRRARGPPRCPTEPRPTRRGRRSSVNLLPLPLPPASPGSTPSPSPEPRQKLCEPRTHFRGTPPYPHSPPAAAAHRSR